MTNIHSKKCNYGESATIKYEITKHDKTIYDSPAVKVLEEIEELEKKLYIACKALDTIRKANNYSIKSEYGLLFASQYAGKVLDELKEVK